MNNNPLTVDFLNLVYEEMAGNQQLTMQLEGKSNAGPTYKLYDDNSTQALANCRFVQRTKAHMEKVLNAPASPEIRGQALLAIVVGCIRFGMYCQRKVNERNGMIV